ncbi:hypothetical protein ABZ558_00080 [Streptomyces coeruleorubidus]|uniref:hypothetical protein n=1 Tax=Streptomyces coeruleorubidus TaxID=116188 RepID=UPI0033E2DA22
MPDDIAPDVAGARCGSGGALTFDDFSGADADPFLTVGALECRRPATLVALKNVYDQANLFLLNQNICPGHPAAVG